MYIHSSAAYRDIHKENLVILLFLFYLKYRCTCIFFYNICLRVRAFLHQIFQICHVYWNFILSYTCWITVNFGTLNDGSLLIHMFASNNCFSDRNVFQNGIHALSKIDAFLTKSWRFHLVRIIWLWSNFASLWHKHLLWNYK